MNILVIGSDSFIAQIFIKKYLSFYNISGISRKKTDLLNEIVLDDFEGISSTVFMDIDAVLNFAAIVHQPHLKDKTLYDKINYKLTIENAKKAKSAGVNYFLQMSTIAVYGDTEVVTVESSYNPINLYGSSKLFADQELLMMQDSSFRVAIIRSPLVYGGGLE